nr:hypothetical protein [Sporosarcina sp. Te-1]
MKEGSTILYSLYERGIDFTAILAILASLFPLTLVTTWGEKLPKRIIILLGWAIGGLTVLISFLTALQCLGVHSKGDMQGMAIWVYLITYGGLFLWGVTVFLATLSFQNRIINK